MIPYLVQDIIPRMTNIIARIKSIILVGKHKASNKPAPNAAKITPLSLPLERDNEIPSPYVTTLNQLFTAQYYYTKQ